MIHGELRVNETEVCTYEVFNTKEKWGDDAVYRVILRGRDNLGFPYEEAFNLLHTPSHGLFVLMQGVFTKAQKVIGKG